VLQNPVVAAQVKICADIALDITSSRYGQGHNDWRDAFRHGLWSACMVRDVGSNWAKRWGDAHETAPGQPAIEKEMDLFNNAVGRSIGSSLGDIHNTYLANSVKQHVDNHKLKCIKSGKLVWTP
jgi:hypothetical protein